MPHVVMSIAVPVTTPPRQKPLVPGCILLDPPGHLFVVGCNRYPDAIRDFLHLSSHVLPIGPSVPMIGLMSDSSGSEKHNDAYKCQYQCEMACSHGLPPFHYQVLWPAGPHTAGGDTRRRHSPPKQNACTNGSICAGGRTEVCGREAACAGQTDAGCRRRATRVAIATLCRAAAGS